MPLHLQPAFKKLQHGVGSFPVAERLARTILSLPVFPELADDEVRFICSEVNAAVSEGLAVI